METKQKFERFSDEEMADMLENPITDGVDIDSRADRFWDVDRQWLPAGRHTGRKEYAAIKDSPDRVFGRYTLGIGDSGTTTSDYWVLDRKNPYFELSLEEFLDAYDKGSLPIEMSRRQKHLKSVKSLGIVAFGITTAGILIWLFLIVVLSHPPSIPHGAFIRW